MRVRERVIGPQGSGPFENINQCMEWAMRVLDKPRKNTSLIFGMLIWVSCVSQPFRSLRDVDNQKAFMLEVATFCDFPCTVYLLRSGDCKLFDFYLDHETIIIDIVS